MPAPLFNPLPPVYKAIFCVLEPAGLLGGAAFAIGFPRQFYEAYLGKGWLGDALYGSSIRGAEYDHAVLVASGMGSCMLIIGLLSMTVLPKISKVLAQYPELHEQILKTYLLALSMGDVAHIVVTLLWAPANVRFSPRTWTILLWGNIVGTALPAIARLAWYSGAGRKDNSTVGRVRLAGPDALH